PKTTMLRPLRKLHTRRDFEAMALPHLDSLYGTALRLTRNERDAEDLVQDAVLKAFRFFHRFEQGTNGRAWLFKILTNTFFNKYRKRQRERDVLEAVEGEGADGLLSDGAKQVTRDPEAVLLGRLLTDRIQAALDALPADFRLAVMLADVEGFTYREIAEIMECPVGTVMSRLYRGRRLLQNRLRQVGVVHDEHGDEELSEPALEAPRLQIIRGQDGDE